MENEISNKQLILKAAERLFVERGFTETKISDISSVVGISDSTIYEHFKSKQEILFTIPSEKNDEILHSNINNLRGLVGAEVKLRKLVWNYLEFFSNNNDYCSLLLFELRPNRYFYEDENKERTLKFTNEYKNVIIEGQNNNEFRSDISPSLVLKIIFGAIDHFVISWLIKPQWDNLMDVFEPFWDLLIHAITIRNIRPKPQDKRNLILAAAATIFATTGYHKARIQDIAKLAGVGDGTIYQYFRNKEDILFTLPIEKTKELITIQEEHLSGIKNPESKLVVLINNYIRFLDFNKDYSSIVLFDLRYNRVFYETAAYELLRGYTHIFLDVITEGIRVKDFRETINPDVAVKMIFGMLDHCLLTWVLFKKPKTLVEICDPVCDLILHALKDYHSH